MTQAIERGARLLLLPLGTPVVALASTGRHGWMVMREPGEIATIRPDRLEAWDGADDAWTGPAFEWDALPFGLRLTVEYYEAKDRLLADPGSMSPRECAGLLLVTHGSGAAAAATAGAFEPEVTALLREASQHIGDA